MSKNKNTELNFLYLDDKYQDKSKNKTKRKSDTKKDTKKKNKVSNNKTDSTRDTFDFDNEIVIGVTKIPGEKRHESVKKVNNKRADNVKSAQDKITEKRKIEPKQMKKTATKKENNKRQVNNRTSQKTNRESINRKVKNTSVKSRFIKWFIKWTILLTALVAAFIFFMMSPLFNVAQIDVINNQKINTETIISLSGIQIGENMYKNSNKKITNNIKQNAYVENVKISRKLPNKIQIDVKERKATFMLEYANSYAYINNQGYILEITEVKESVPVIKGYTTIQEDIKLGNRLTQDDLDRMTTVLKIMESANGNGLQGIITKIDISNKQNYILILEEKKKAVYIGDGSNLSNRMLYLKAILADTEGLEGEIFVNGDLNKENVFFRNKE